MEGLGRADTELAPDVVLLFLVRLAASLGRSGFFPVSARPWASHLHSPHLISSCILKKLKAQCQEGRAGNTQTAAWNQAVQREQGR